MHRSHNRSTKKMSENTYNNFNSGYGRNICTPSGQRKKKRKMANKSSKNVYRSMK